MKNCLFFLFSTLFYHDYLHAQQTETVYLSGTDAANTVPWDFYCTEGQNSGRWTKIAVPSNWELQGFGNYNYGQDYKKKDIKLGKEHGLYRHRFNVPANWKGKVINLVFDGAMTDTKVTVNGKPAGEIHQGGFYRFKYDISSLVKFGKSNLLEVDVARHSGNVSVNNAERQSDFWIFGGIFRPVFLQVLPSVHMSRMAVDARADGSFNVLAEVNQPGPSYSLSAQVFDLQGKPLGKAVNTAFSANVSSQTITGTVPHVHSWNPERPTQYQIAITLKKGEAVLHEVTERIGFRTVELRRNDGFYVNGEKVVFKGVNRHSFWPETGRCLSEANMLDDIRLIKEMNMNAVRCSHYVPDERFLQLCDSLGLFVLDEVTGWQASYDTIVGPKLIKETILKDENHACVVIWDHGNEGGWDFTNEKWFHYWDIQKRPVINPWLLRNGVDTYHYPAYDFAIGRNVFGSNPFMATELLHGLYDGGAGAGLEEYWRSYESAPLLAGGFLWVLADEAVLRTDKPGKVFDSDGNQAPDGLLGPHHEKEGSFYTVKEIWSPVQVAPVTINPLWNGKLFLQNKYIYTNLNSCHFNWKAVKTSVGKTQTVVIGSGVVASPNAAPGETAAVTINGREAIANADIFLFTAKNEKGNELFTWSWPIVQPSQIAARLILSNNDSVGEVSLNETATLVQASAAGITIAFDKKSGTLQSVNNRQNNISLTGGLPVGVESAVTSAKFGKNANGDFTFEVSYSKYPEKVLWVLKPDGMVMMEASPLTGAKEVEFIGMSFNYPEAKCTGIQWMGRGPYRVWKNRLKGGTVGVWEKSYNNTITGETFDNLVYPEFKGYHANLYWAKLQTTEGNFTVATETPNLFFQLFTPAKPQHVAGGVYPPFPPGDLSFLYEIPAIGTKFKKSVQLGPKSHPGNYSGHKGDEFYPIKLWFDFR